MRTMQDNERTALLIRKYHIDDCFTVQNLRFQLRQYEKGEFLCSPVKPLDAFLFLVGGTVHLYDLQQNGGKRSIGIASDVTLFGDMEFSTGMPSSFFAEALEAAVCLALPMQEYEEMLWEDAKFLGYVVRALAEKLQSNAVLELSTTKLEEKVLHYLEKTPEISGVEKTAMYLHCSRRQLQRVLKKLCEDGRLSKNGKGQYTLQ